MTSTTPFPLGAYIGQPNNASAADEAAFTAEYNSFTGLMGAAPQFLNYYIDQSQPVSQWVGNAQWAATSAAASPAKSAAPVIALPLTSTASALTADQQYQAFASGQYDSTIQGAVQVWAQQGFTTQYWRPGWEMNIPSMPSYAGTDAQTQADWVRAFQHVSAVLHQAGTADGVNVQVVWNPTATNYDPLGVLQNLYPGNASVDIIGADAYADMYPYSPLYDWDKNNGTVDSSLAQFIADPVNRLHYWNYPAATPYSLDGSDGHNLDLQTLLAFAKAQGKPLAVPETGAGNAAGGHDVADDPQWAQWLAQTLQASGDKIGFVNLWDSNGGGNFEFSSSAAGKPQAAAAWAQYFGAQATTTGTPNPTTPVVVGSGADIVALKVSEDAWQGDAQFTVTVDGTQVGGTQTATASHAAGADQVFDVEGNFGAGLHAVTADFLNDAYGGSPSTDRNLYVDGAGYDGTAASPGTLALYAAGRQSLTVGTASAVASSALPTVTLGTGNDSLALEVSEDAWQGDAQFTVTVDGHQVGATQTALASHAAGQDQTFVVDGNFGPGSHAITVNFLNDAYGGSPSTDRNLYVDGATYDGQTVTGAFLSLHSAGPQSFHASVPSSLTLAMSEDAWQGDAQFTVTVDGKATGGVNTVTALHSTGATQTFTFDGTWSAGTHTVAVDFLNDAYGGSPSTDRNLYVTGATFNGHANPESVALYSAGPQSFTVS
jgi:hypothetical protein